MDEKKTFPGGATRTNDVGNIALHLCPWEGLRLWAEAMETGRISHGAHNWRGGFPISECLNHAIRHLYLFAEGGEAYHVGHAMANLGFIAHFLTHRPDLDDRPAMPPPATNPVVTAEKWLRLAQDAAAEKAQSLPPPPPGSPVPFDKRWDAGRS